MQDWQTFLKLDNAGTIQFLASYAAALANEGLVSERCLENFKGSLATITPMLASTQRSILPLLAESNDDFVAVLTARYGVSGLAWNHMRISTRGLLSESCANLAFWADLTLKKAELFMNRPFVAVSAFGESRRELFPSVLFHAAKTLHDTAKELRQAIHDLSLMRPADILDTTGLQHGIEGRIAIQVGFSGLESETLSYCRTEQRVVRKIVAAFEEMAASILQIVVGLRQNTANLANSKHLEIECEILMAECQRLSGVRFEVSSNLDVWETRRLGFLHEIFELNQRMNQAAKLFSETLIPKDKLTELEFLTSDVERAVICSLIKRGTPPHTATTAANDLMDYCRAHKATPSALIPAELKKINAELLEDTLAFAATLTSDSLTATPGGSGEKARFIDAAKKIRKALNVTVPFSSPMATILFGLILNSCGFKTGVVSDVPDERPKIAFHKQEPHAEAPPAGITNPMPTADIVPATVTPPALKPRKAKSQTNSRKAKL
jgi:hypothetical protein